MSKKLRAFSLIEPLISIIIISSIISISVFTVNNLTTDSITSKQKTKAWITLQEYHKRTIIKRSFWNEKENFNGFIIEKSIEKFRNYRHLVQLNYTVYSIKQKKVLDFSTVADEIMEE